LLREQPSPDNAPDRVKPYSQVMRIAAVVCLKRVKRSQRAKANTLASLAEPADCTTRFSPIF
jgi:hypothetical protein